MKSEPKAVQSGRELENLTFKIPTELLVGNLNEQDSCAADMVF
jgi:hypothetical protein